jgi:hypothetical protein
MGKLNLPSLYEAVYGMPGTFDGRYGYGSKLQRDPGLGDNQGRERAMYINMDNNLNPEDQYELTDDEEELGEEIYNMTRGYEYAPGNQLHPNDYGYMPSYNAGITENHTNPVRPVATPYSYNYKPATVSPVQGPIGLTTKPGGQKTGTIYGTSRPYYDNDEDPDDLTYDFSIDSFAMDKDEHAELAFKKQQKNVEKVQKKIKSNFY